MKQVSGEERLPYFSVIIPVHNRATTIRRCLDSCLSQDFEDYEIIVVDDASEDDSVAVVETYLPNTHLKLVKSKKNCGVCASRGLGVKHACGRWIMFIDSDDSFHPGAFQTIYEETSKAPAEVSEVRFCYYREEIGKITPIPMMPEGIIGFPEYLQWCEKLLFRKGSYGDLLYCQRREIYDFVSWPIDRQHELLYHFQLASKIKMMMSRKVVGTMHDDAPNRITRHPYGAVTVKSKQFALDDADSKAKLLKDYGEQMKKESPNVHTNLFCNTGKLYMLCGEKLKGTRYLLRYLSMRPWSIKGWCILILGLMGPVALNTDLRVVKKTISFYGSKLPKK